MSLSEFLQPSNGTSATTSDYNSKMPHLHKAIIGHLKTFILPDIIRDDVESKAFAQNMIDEWRKTEIFKIQITPAHSTVLEDCFKKSKEFFQCSFKEKSKHVNDQSFAGYIASGEEMTDNIADYSEIFTITKDLKLSDSRVKNRWPCHGPTPWPNEEYKLKMDELMRQFGEYGEYGDKLLKLTALGLGLDHSDDLLKMIHNGWHHMRVLRFPQVDKTNGEGLQGRGIGSHRLWVAGHSRAGRCRWSIREASNRRGRYQELGALCGRAQ
jgi:isopenicillin N synthase-like dioxygenase